MRRAVGAVVRRHSTALLGRGRFAVRWILDPAAVGSSPTTSTNTLEYPGNFGWGILLDYA